MRLLIVTVLIAACALTMSCKESASDKAFGGRVREYLLRHPEVLEEAVDALEAKKAKEKSQGHAAALNRYRDAIERNPMDFVANPNGRITVTEFYDFRCGFCRKVAPDMVALIRENPDVRFVFKDMPIFGGDSSQAAAMALAAKDDGKYLTLYQAFFAAPELTSEGIDRIVADVGLNPTALKAKAAGARYAAHLAANLKLARDIGFEGTPHFVVGDTLIAGADMDAVKAAIARARKAG